MKFRHNFVNTLSSKFGIKKIDANVNSGNIQFGQQTHVDPLSIVELVQNDPASYKILNANQLNFSHKSNEPNVRLDFINNLLEKLKIAPERAE